MKFFIFVSWEHDPDFMSSRIMKKFKTHYSHIGMILEVDGQKEIYHSVGKGFSTENLNLFKQEHGLDVLEVTQLIKDKQFAFGYLKGRIGVEYSLSQYVGFVFPELRKLVRNKEQKGICSEEAARFLYHCCHHDAKVNPDKFDFVSPKDVWEKVKSVVSGEPARL